MRREREYPSKYLNGWEVPCGRVCARRDDVCAGNEGSRERTRDAREAALESCRKSRKFIERLGQSC
jgi:hypothetical protein